MLREKPSFDQVIQGIIALTTVVGGGVAVVFEPQTREVMGAFIGLVLGYYFRLVNGREKTPPTPPIA